MYTDKFIESLIDKSPKELSQIKNGALEVFNFQRAMVVQDYIKHCMTLNKMVKNIISGL